MYIVLLLKSKIVEVLKICFKSVSSSCGKEKDRLKERQSQPMASQLLGIQIQNEVLSNQKQPSYKKRCGPLKNHGEKM